MVSKFIIFAVMFSFYSTSQATWREGGGGDADASEALSLMKNELVETLKWSKAKVLKKIPLSEIKKVIQEIDDSLNKTETSEDDLLVFDENIESSGAPKGCKYQRNDEGQSRILCDREAWTIWSLLDEDLNKGKKIGTLYKEIAGMKGFGEKNRYFVGLAVEAEFLKMKRAKKRKKRRNKKQRPKKTTLDDLLREARGEKRYEGPLGELLKEAEAHGREIERNSRLPRIGSSDIKVGAPTQDPDALREFSRDMDCELARRACSKGNNDSCFSLGRSCGAF